MSPLERNWSTKPIINNSFAFRYVTSQIWIYYGIFGFMPNERARIHEHKAPFRKQLSAQAFKCTPLPVYVRDAFRTVHGHCLGGFVFKRATHGIRCSSLVVIKQRCIAATPPSGLGWIACIRCKASCTEPRCPYRDGWYEYMYRATPNK